MKKNIAVIVRDRHAEALRMAVGLTLNNDSVDVFLMDTVLDRSDSSIAMNIEMLGELRVRIISNRHENGVETLSTEDIGLRLPQYDTVIPY